MSGISLRGKIRAPMGHRLSVNSNPHPIQKGIYGRYGGELWDLVLCGVMDPTWGGCGSRLGSSSIFHFFGGFEMRDRIATIPVDFSGKAYRELVPLLWRAVDGATIATVKRQVWDQLWARDLNRTQCTARMAFHLFVGGDGLDEDIEL